MNHVVEIGRQRVLRLADVGPAISRESASDLVGDALSEAASVVGLPVQRLDAEFFRLASGIAGELAQKLVNYRVRLAVVGDIAAHLEQSAPLRDWVREANRGRELMFVADWGALEERLAGEA